MFSNFNPRPPRGGRPYVGIGFVVRYQFQSTPPARGATAGADGDFGSGTISIHAPREGGDVGAVGAVPQREKISIHAPREGGDRGFYKGVRTAMSISIHAPREGGDSRPCRSGKLETDFNPRPPRGGRPSGTIRFSPRPKIFQSTPPARGATAASRRLWYVLNSISIHAPREGGDDDLYDCNYLMFQFQSTPPARGATAWSNLLTGMSNISIHAPREGGDAGQRHKHHVVVVFQSTPPARGATWRASGRRCPAPDFNPRPPRGGRQQRCTVLPADL